MKLNWFGATAAAALMVSFAPLAIAPAQAADADAGALPEVIVQARRVDENQQKVPVAVTTLAAKTLAQDTVTQVDNLAGLVPSLTVDPGSLGGSASPSFTVRGLSETVVTDPSVVPYFDQVVSDPRNFAYALYDLSSIEVLKGPQGTLFGKNSTGGAVLLNPAATPMSATATSTTASSRARSTCPSTTSCPPGWPARSNGGTGPSTA